MTTIDRGVDKPTSRRIARDILLSLPVAIGGIVAIVAGAWDYIPWLTSPALWLGVLVTVALSIGLIRIRAATPSEVIEGVVVGVVLCGVGVLATYVAVVLFWVVWQPIG